MLRKYWTTLGSIEKTAINLNVYINSKAHESTPLKKGGFGAQLAK